VRENNFNCLIDCGVKLSAEGKDMYPDLSDINFSELDAVIISHGHLDHCGYVPFLFAHGYSGPVYATHPTRQIAKVIQDDFAFIQKEQTGWAPYWRDDIRKAKQHTVALDYLEKVELKKDIYLTFHDAGHILGAAQVLIETPSTSLLYTGDINTKKTRVMGVADTNMAADIVITEATYSGDFDVHKPLEQSEEELISVINQTVVRGGKVVIPVFAIGRAQNIIMTLKAAYDTGMLSAPVYLDGMLQRMNQIYDDFPAWMNDDMYQEFQKGNPFEAGFLAGVQDRRRILRLAGPAVVVTTAGMMSGGPVLSYFKEWASDERNTFALVGYQVEGTLGRQLMEGERTFLVDGTKVIVKADIRAISFSAHADQQGLIGHIQSLKRRPDAVFLCHGDPDKVSQLAQALTIPSTVAEPKVTYTLKEARTGHEPIEPSFESNGVQLVITTPRDDIVKKYMIQMIRSAHRKIRIAGYVDTALTDELIGAMRRNVELSVIFRHVTRPSNREAFRILKSQGASIRENRDLHARMVLVDDRYAFISSADLTRDSFYDHFEAGFLVKDQEMVVKTVSFFEKVWQESYDL
jgi:predicted metal-dependent RNase